MRMRTRGWQAFRALLGASLMTAAAILGAVAIAAAQGTNGVTGAPGKDQVTFTKRGADSPARMPKLSPAQ